VISSPCNPSTSVEKHITSEISCHSARKGKDEEGDEEEEQEEEEEVMLLACLDIANGKRVKLIVRLEAARERQHSNAFGPQRTGCGHHGDA
jgi:hypothetical protein